MHEAITAFGTVYLKGIRQSMEQQNRPLVSEHLHLLGICVGNPKPIAVSNHMHRVQRFLHLRLTARAGPEAYETRRNAS